jgi:hypothetical protein
MICKKEPIHSVLLIGIKKKKGMTIVLSAKRKRKIKSIDA